MTKIVVIGLDSATFDVIEPLVAQGRLPVFAKLMKEGVWGRLKSTVPPVTPPAWTSMITGKNPGKHGIFDFYGHTVHGYDRPVVSSQSVQAKTLWRLLSENEKTVGVINVPLTYPPEKVNGFIIPGMQYAFDVKKGFSYPDGLMSEIEDKFGKYEVVYGDERALYTEELDHFILKWKEITKKRQDVILYLLEKHRTDFFMPVFYSIDPIQHHFWKFYDSTHPLYDESLAGKYKDVIPEFYELIDTYIGQIIEKAGKETTVFVVSDHGAGAHKGGLYVNKWLMKEKLLSIKKRYYPLVYVKWPHIFYKILKRLGSPAIAWTIPLFLYLKLMNRVDPREGLRLTEIIDWKKTKVFAGNYTEQGIYINLKGREAEGTVSREEYHVLRDYVGEGLKSIIDPETGETIVDQVIRKEDVYNGPYTEFASDLFIMMKNGSILLQKDVHKGLFLRSPHISGTHRMEGVFIGKGNMLKESLQVKDPHITDITPTILYLFGLDIPVDMDGRVLDEIIRKDFLDKTPKKSGPPSSLDGRQGTYSDEETEKIKETLRNLGYA